MMSSVEKVKPRIFVDSIESLEATFHELIPISRALGIQVQEYDGNALTVLAPLAPNLNHQHSAFGGSLFSVAVLAGWGLMQLKLSELLLDCNTVVMGGEVLYERPVYDDLICTCKLPDNADDLFRALADNGTSSAEMISEFTANNKPAMRLKGQYHLRQRK